MIQSLKELKEGATFCPPLEKYLALAVRYPVTYVEGTVQFCDWPRRRSSSTLFGSSKGLLQ